MLRFLIASVVIGSCCHALASDTASPGHTVPRTALQRVAPHVVPIGTASPTSAVRYVAKIKFQEVRQQQTSTMQAEVAGVTGTPLKIDLSSQSMARQLKLELRDVPSSKPTQYLTQFEWVELRKDGTSKVLFAPKIVTTVGTPATMKVGEEKGDRFEFNLTVTERASTACKSKPATQDPTNSKQPSVPPPSSMGVSLMRMVDPRIIIQEEEEDRLEVVQP